MLKSIKLSDALINARNINEVLERLEEYKNNGIIYLTSYGFQGIEIQDLINRIELLKKETTDLEEIGKGIMSYINS